MHHFYITVSQTRQSHQTSHSDHDQRCTHPRKAWQDVSVGNQSQPYTRTRTHTTTIYSKLYIHDVLCQQRHSAIPIGFCIITSSIFPLQKKNYTSSFWQGKSKMKKKRFQSETMPRNKYCKTSGLWNIKKAASEVLVRLWKQNYTVHDYNCNRSQINFLHILLPYVNNTT